MSSKSELVEYDPSLAFIGQFWFWRRFLCEKRKKSYVRFSIKPEVTDWSCWFSIPNTGLPMETTYPNLNKIGQKLRPWECRIQKFNMAADESSNWDIENLRKMSQAHVLETLFSKFHQNRLSYLGCRADKDTLTHRHTHKQPRSILTYSVKMTEYKKISK